MHKGSCLCGGVAFETSGNLEPATSCHCSQCRKQSGHYWCSTSTDCAKLTFTSDTTLAWFNASPAARRGFCGTCGSFLFWKHDDEAEISISMSAFDTPTGVRLARHIFVADKGDHYDITDGLPQTAQ